MEIYYKNCRGNHGTYKVNAEEKPVFFLLDNPAGVNIYEAGFEEAHYGLWCHFLSKEENEKMNKYLESRNEDKRKL